MRWTGVEKRRATPWARSRWAGRAGDGLARVDADLARAPQAAPEIIRLHGLAAGEYAPGGEQLDVVAQTGSEIGKFAQDGEFVVGIGQMQRAGVGVPDIGPGGEVEPEVAGAQGTLVDFARRLADGPDHAEVADGGALRLRGALEEDDAVAAFGGGQGVGQADDAGANDGDVCFVFGHVIRIVNEPLDAASLFCQHNKWLFRDPVNLT